MGNKKKLFKNKKRKRRNEESLVKARAERLSKKRLLGDGDTRSENIKIEHEAKGIDIEMSLVLNKDMEQNTTTESNIPNLREFQNQQELFTPTLSPETMDTSDLIIEKEILPESYQNVEGRRLVDFQYFFNQIKVLNNHCKATGCTIDNLQVLKERTNGLHSIFFMKCNMCDMRFQLSTSDSEAENMDVNHGAVTGAMMAGLGRSNLNELLASVDLPIFPQSLYAKCHQEVAKWWKSAAEKSMEEAAKEEAIKAVACGDVKDGIPVLTVIADCCWSKRSYKTNYTASSGVAAIIGYKTGKVLYMDVKNKYCAVCNRAAIKSKPPVNHECFKNHSGSSTSMEQCIIVEGFKTSVARQNVIYGTLIADGDASTYKKILESRPYANHHVEKVECTNHLLRNYTGKIVSIGKDTAIPLPERRFLTGDRQKRLRIAVKYAIRFRKSQNTSHYDQILNLKKDILNSPLHIFGDHNACDSYYCFEEKKAEENLVPKAKTLMKKIMALTSQLAFHSKSLLYNVTNNRAEQFNSVVAKFVGGKRINFSLRNSYTARSHAAVVSFNSTRPQYAIYKSKFNRSPGKSLKRIETARLTRTHHEKKNRRLKKKLFSSDRIHYGEECQRPDMSAEDYNVAKNVFLKNLKEQVNNREEVERDTILQAESALWLELRRCLVTASSFGKVCKRRQNISSAPIVKSHLYAYSLDYVSSVKHGKTNETIAIQQLAVQENININKCGLFIDKDFFFLGASPDGVFEGGIIEIKCPFSAFGINAEDAIKQKIIKFWNADGSVNRRHEWFYQVQGQLHISGKSLCLLAVWTGKEIPLKVEKITRDDDFWQHQMKNRLIDYYYKCLLPEIVDPRKSRSMPLRSTSF